MSRRPPPPPPDLGGEPDAASLEAVWDLLDRAAPDSDRSAETDEAWDALRTRLGIAGAAAPGGRPQVPQGGAASTPLRTAPKRPVPRRLPRSALAAAAVAGVVATGVLAARGIPASAVAEPGTMAQVQLPDGSRAELNSGSRLTWRRGLLPGSRPARSVRLEGEAFLEVVPGERPFTVETFNARVTVLGTRFNVRARPEAGGGTSVALEEGRVRLEALGSFAPVELLPGQGSTVPLEGGAPESPAPVAVDRALVWRDRGLSAVDLPLESILRELERRFAVEIRLSPEVDGLERLTLYYAGPGDVRSILSDLATARELNFRETRDGFEVF